MVSIVDLAIRKAGLEVREDKEKQKRESISEAIQRLTEVVEMDKLVEGIKAMSQRDNQQSGPLAALKDLGFDMRTHVEAMRDMARESREREQAERERADQMQLALFQTLAKMMETKDNSSARYDPLEFVKLVTSIQQANQQQLQQLQKELLEERLKPQKDPVSEAMLSVLSGVVQQALHEKLSQQQQDPFQQVTSVIQAVRQLSSVLQPQAAKSDPQIEQFRLQLDLKKIELEHQLAMHKLERQMEVERERTQTYAKIAEAIGQIVAQAAPLLLGGRGQGVHPVGAPVAAVPTQTGVLTICRECGYEFAVPPGLSMVTCPRCQAALPVGGQAASAPTPNGSPKPGPGVEL